MNEPLKKFKLGNLKLLSKGSQIIIKTPDIRSRRERAFDKVTRTIELSRSEMKKMAAEHYLVWAEFRHITLLKLCKLRKKYQKVGKILELIFELNHELNDLHTQKYKKNI